MATPPAAPIPHRRAETLNVLSLTLALVIAAFMAWITRAAVNPDGVAYLDLARALRDGKFEAFLQGYWSPLYPALLAVIGPRIAAAHVLNAILAAGGAWLLSRAIRRYLGAVPDDGAHAIRVSAVWSAYAVAAFVLVRVSAITPDMALLVCVVGWAAEVTSPRGVRWFVAGTWLGIGFLAKTSLWPWMIVGTCVLLWHHRALRAPAVARTYVTPMLAALALWLIPLSLREGRPTVGVTGSLNACWFLRACDGQSPDTHRGRHVAYERLVLSRGETITRVRFPDPTWTYAPWSDPDRWSKGVQSQSSTPLSIARYAGIVAANIKAAILFSLGYVLVGPLLALVAWHVLRRAARRPIATWGDASLLLVALAGIAQFVAVQAVTRTLAPFVLAGAVAITLGARPLISGRSVRPAWRVALVALPAVVAVVAIARVARYEWQLARLSEPYAAEMLTLSERASNGFAQRTVMAVGAGIPLMPLAAELGVHIVAQVPPGSVSMLDMLSPSDRRAALVQLAAGSADVAWEVDASGRSRVTGLR